MISTTQIAKILNSPINSNVSREITSLLTDSRSLENPENTLFFAIQTKGNDGHRYIQELYQKGVRAFVVNHIPDQLKNKTDIAWFLVDDVIKSLQLIAKRKKEYSGEILAITGSRGKTTLKEWLFQLLESKYNISRSPRSYNSQIGVPLSMFEIAPDTNMAIIEAGVSQRGEMSRLAECILPDTVIFTNIGPEHQEGFASIDEKISEKLHLAAPDSVKTIIYSLDQNPIASQIQQEFADRNLISWSISDANASILLNISGSENNITKIDYRYNDISSDFSIEIDENYDIENAANSLAVMLLSGFSESEIKTGFANLHKLETRLNVSDGLNSCSIIYDSYTSDFSSLRPALHFMRRRKTPSQSATLILSDLHHESSATSDLYPTIASLIKQSGITRFIGIGPTLKRFSNIFGPNSYFFDSVGSLTAALDTFHFANEIILLKGSPEYNLSSIAQHLEARKHETILEVNLDAITANYNYFRSAIPSSTGIVCMVKASGYGAGSYEIAKTLQDCGAAYLAVAVLDEGLELRHQGITMPIMVMNPKAANYQAMFNNGLEPEIYSFKMLNDVIEEAKKSGIKHYPVHIKLDTGMHRMGFIEEELPKLMDILASSEEIRAHSVFSHLATADCPDMDDYTELQLSRFAKATDFMLANYPYPILRHILNSAGILRYGKHHYDMVRLGIGLYGANTLPQEMEKPLAVVSSLKTTIISLRNWKAGETIGYGRRGKLSRDSKIATLPIGYADGMNRHFGQGAIQVCVNGKMAPTIGNICMDACMIDVTDIDCQIGDRVEIFGPNAPLQRLADTLDTIPYEILTSISPRVKRVYFRE